MRHSKTHGYYDRITGLDRNYYEDYWTGWAGEWDRSVHPDIEAVLDANVGSAAAVLDVGCGDGTAYQRMVADRARSYTGVDVSETAVDNASKLELDARVIDDAARLPFDDGSFDVCLAFEVLEHLWAPHEAIREMRRVLAPGGTLIATVPNVVSWRHRLDILLLGRFNPGGHPTLSADEPWHDPHIRFFSRRTLGAMARSEKFIDVEVGGAAFSLFGQMPFIRRRGASERLSEPFRPLQDRFPSLLSALLVLRATKPE